MQAVDKAIDKEELAVSRRAGPGLVRDRATWTQYVLLALLGYLLAGLGAALAPLQDDLGVGRAQVAFYPSLFAAGLLAVSALGPRLVASLGRETLSRIAVVLLATGALALCSGVRPLTMAGAALIGLGGAVVVQLVPAGLTERHGPAAPVAIGEANALSSAASVLGPLCVGAAIGLGVDWRAGFLLVPVATAAVLAPALGVTRAAGAAGDVTAEPATGAFPPGPMPGRWLDLLLAISVEFCVLFWAADALRSWHDAGGGEAAAATALFVGGMAAARGFSQRVLTGREPLRVTAAGAALALAGFACFWASPNLAGSAAGLLVTGIGISLFYPVFVARVVAAWPARSDAAASRAALASGVAIGLAPLLLAALADVVGLRPAYLVVPAALVLLALRSRRAARRAPR